MRYRYSYLIILLVALALAACGGQTAGDVSGTWNGTSSTTGAPLTLVLTQNGTSLNGTLSFGGTEGIPMTGTTTGGLLSLSYQDTSGAVQIEASVDGNSMQGTLTLSLADGTGGSSAFTASR